MTVTTKPTSPTKPDNRPDSILTRHRSDERLLRTRQRRTGLLALSALLIVGSAIAGGLLITRIGDRVEVLEVRTAVPRGHAISAENLVSRSVSGVPNAISATDTKSIAGSVAAVDLVPGQILTTRLISRRSVPGPGEALLGLSLAPGRVPSAGLAAGDLVDVIAVPASNGGDPTEALKAPPTLANRARIHDVKESASEGGAVLVTLVVDESDASRIAAYSTVGRTALIETSSGRN
jgi:hypothetical protein